jgi:2-keto-4-pentenoate hydratase/2-oxohepta-3-ene-1,7-dioic acid hydratase in catechol pathway
MRFCWFDDYRLGVVDKDGVADVTAIIGVLPAATYPPREKGDLLVAHLDKVIPAAREALDGAVRKPLEAVHFLSPIASPTKIIGVPVNYLKHVEEAHEQREEFTTRYAGALEGQGLFLKANSALSGFGEGARVRFTERRNDHEMELGMVIGKAGSDIQQEDALAHVAGYTIALDFVVRGPEDRSFRKSPDTYALVGPWLTTADEIADPQNLDFSLKVNGEIRQASNTRHMIMSLKKQIAWASRFYTLYPGDIFMTGTCEGVGPIVPGDVLECEIEGVAAGTLKVA